MKDYSTNDFVRTGNESFLGKYYADYRTVEIRHKEKGTTANILTDANGDPVQEANNITDRIRAAFSLKGRESKIIPIMIEGVKFLVLKFPTI